MQYCIVMTFSWRDSWSITFASAQWFSSSFHRAVPRLVISTRLRAYRLPASTCRARYTSPQPPDARNLLTTKRSAVSPERRSPLPTFRRAGGAVAGCGGGGATANGGGGGARAAATSITLLLAAGSSPGAKGRAGEQAGRRRCHPASQSWATRATPPVLLVSLLTTAADDQTRQWQLAAR